MHKLRPLPTYSARRRQAGTALFVALISLVVMTLGAFALVRAIDTSTIIAGNVGFKQAALISSDAGLEAAITWLNANKNNLANDISAEGYYATEQTGLDIMGTVTPANPVDDVDWDGNNGASATKAKMQPVDQTGNTVAYIINRLCLNAGSTSDPNQSCLGYQGTGDKTSDSHSGPSYSSGPPPKATVSQTYYRITARVTGPRNTVTYVQAVVVI